MQGYFIGSDILAGAWRVDKYHDLADIIPMDDSQEHIMGDECPCGTVTTKPRCSNCGDKHFVIVLHRAVDGRNALPAEQCRDTLILHTMNGG